MTTTSRHGRCELGAGALQGVKDATFGQWRCSHGRVALLARDHDGAPMEGGDAASVMGGATYGVSAVARMDEAGALRANF